MTETMARFMLAAFVLFISTVEILSRQPPAVEIEDGKLEGTFMTTKNGREFNAFLGIPYAEPPVGELRFAPPVPKKPWQGTKDATKVHGLCPQRDIYRRVEIFEGDEDCLYLNVYTPEIPNKNDKPLPVMVWLHGGGWLCGSGNSMFYGPNILMDQDIVLVVPNYRLGFLGFMTTGDLVVPGNNGLKDQNLVLQWVKKNIAKFGGDENKVTIFGESAGGASSHFHMLSSKGRDLIHRVIAQSGTAFSNWAIAPNDQGIRNTKKMAKLLNCPTDCSQKMLECLRAIKDPMEFIKQDAAFMEWDFDPMIPFKPVIEIPHEGALLSEHPADIYRSGRAPNIPMIVGLNSEDGALRAAGIFGDPKVLQEFSDQFDRLAPMSLEYDLTAPNIDFVTSKIKEFYLKNKKIDNTSVKPVIDMYTDAWFLSATDDAIRLHLKYTNSPIYYYLFAYRGVESFTRIFGDPHNDYGVCHADDLQYLFPVGDGLWPDKKPSENCKKVSQIMTTLWANFAKTGNPTPELNDLIDVNWEPVQSDEQEYLNIGKDGLKLERGLFSERTKFWRDLPTAYRKNTIRDEL